MQETGPVGGPVLFGNRQRWYNMNKTLSTSSEKEQETIASALHKESDSEEARTICVQSLQFLKG